MSEKDEGERWDRIVSFVLGMLVGCLISLLIIIQPMMR